MRKKKKDRKDAHMQERGHQSVRATVELLLAIA
jgi:hypothetical protein